MATTPEGKVKLKVKKILDELGAYHFSPMMTGFGHSGVPDIIACYKGIFLGIECKSGKNIPTLLQENNMKRIRNAGGYTMVVNESNISTLLTTIKELV
jgi:Holliday junction resolvase